MADGTRVFSGDTVDTNLAMRVDVFTFSPNTSYTLQIDGTNRTTMTTDQFGNVGTIFVMATPNGTHTVQVKDTATGHVPSDSVIQLTTTGAGTGAANTGWLKYLIIGGIAYLGYKYLSKKGGKIRW